jgi:hypothetical protein
MFEAIRSASGPLKEAGSKYLSGTEPPLQNFLDNFLNEKVIKPFAVQKNGDGIYDNVQGTTQVFFVFDVAAEQKVDLKTSISEHFAENGTYFTDNAVNEPIRITLSGFIGEKVIKTKNTNVLGSLASGITSRLSILDSYVPNLTAGANQKIGQAYSLIQRPISYIDGAISQGKEIYSLFDKKNQEQTRQEKAFAKIKAAFEGRKIFDVYTGLGFFPNMMIEECYPTRDLNDSDLVMSLSITLKQVRLYENKISSIGVAKARAAAATGRAASNLKPPVNAGKVEGKRVMTTAKYLFNQRFGR